MSRSWTVTAAMLLCAGCQKQPETTTVNGEIQGVTFQAPSAWGRPYVTTLVSEKKRITVVLTDEPNGCEASEPESTFGTGGQVRGPDGGVVPSLWLDMEDSTASNEAFVRFHDQRGSVVADTATVDLYDTFERNDFDRDNNARGTFSASFDGGTVLSGEFVAARCANVPKQSCAGVPGGGSGLAALGFAAVVLLSRRSARRWSASRSTPRRQACP